MSLYIENKDVIVYSDKMDEDANRLHLLVINAGCIGARWPMVAKYKGQLYQWDCNEFIPREWSSSVYGYGTYKKAVDGDVLPGYNSLILND